MGICDCACELGSQVGFVEEEGRPVERTEREMVGFGLMVGLQIVDAG